MTERQAREIAIEMKVERMIDRLDARFMRFEMEEEEYDQAMKRIRAWADEQIDLLR
jgi:hypothetical protein